MITNSPESAIRANLYPELAALSVISPFDFPSQLLRALADHLPIKAASFYSFTNESERCPLTLRSAFGVDYKHYDTFELGIKSLVGVAANERCVVVSYDLESDDRYQSKKLISAYDLTCCMAIPIFSPINYRFVKVEDCIGVICLYPKSAGDITQLKLLFSEIQASLGTYYMIAVKQVISLLGEKIEQRVFTTTDLGSCLHKIVALTKQEFSVEASSVFLYDLQQRRLKLKATTGIDLESEDSKHIVFYDALDSDRKTWLTYKERKHYIVRSLDESGYRGKFLETVKGSRESFISVPIDRLHQRKPDHKHTIGVFRMLNKQIKFGGSHKIVGFSWEDRIVAEFIADTIAIFTHTFSSRDQRIDYFEQIMHGSGSSISACLQNLDIAERYGRLSEKIEPSLKFTISDTKDYLTDIKNQMDRLSDRSDDEFLLAEVQITGDILRKIVNLFEHMAKSRGIKSEVTNLKSIGFFSAPTVWSNSEGLLTVFRNLVENAIKYHDRSVGVCKIDLSYRIEGSNMAIRFKDNGIGVPIDERYLIFDVGYRAANALRLEPASTGLGLAQASAIMKRLRGTITLIDPHPTTFEVQIPLFRCR